MARRKTEETPPLFEGRQVVISDVDDKTGYQGVWFDADAEHVYLIGTVDGPVKVIEGHDPDSGALVSRPAHGTIGVPRARIKLIQEPE